MTGFPWGKLPEAQVGELRALGQLAAGVGARLYVVGGWVRDVILGHPHKDRDLSVDGDAREFAEALATTLPHGLSEPQVEWHERFLTTTVSWREGDAEHCIDIATTRTETYAHPGALPTVRPARILDDLWRRDFACNAAALSLNSDDFGTLLDPCGGLHDIDRRLIRILHGRSFIDDPTRILRAINFERRLDFRLEPTTEEALRLALSSGALWTVSTDRISDVLHQGLQSDAAAEIVARTEELGVWRALGVGPFTPNAASVAEAVCGSLSVLSIEDTTGRSAAYFAGLAVAGGDAAPWLGLLSVTEQQAALAAVKLTAEPPVVLRQVQALPSEVTSALAGTHPAALAVVHSMQDGLARRRIEQFQREWRHVRSDVTGDDLLQAGCATGPAIGEALRAALAAKLDHNAPREAQLALALQIVSNVNC